MDIFETCFVPRISLDTGATRALKTDLTPALGGFVHPAASSFLDLSLSIHANDPITLDPR